MLKTVGSKISNEYFLKILSEINRLGLTKSQFLRMVLDNYFNEQNSNDNIKVNQPKVMVNRVIDEDNYKTTNY